MYDRNLELPDTSFFLLGPRSTGKTSWLGNKLPQAIWFNLLLEEDYLSLTTDSGLLIRKLEAVKDGSWVVIDEIQKIPALLNSVHYLLTKYPGKFKFALSGSSARKLRRLDVNMLAGRVIEKNFFPLTADELGSNFNINDVLNIGSLPLIHLEPKYAQERLLAYVNTYLKQEIQQEALVGDFPAFARFLRVASILNGTVLNYSNISRDAQVNRKIVEKFFSVLVETLIAFWLPAWQPKATVKEVAKPKFYFFDCGVVRACANRVSVPMTAEEKGFLLETYILHELRAYLNRSGIRGELSYWKSGSGSEVDFIWSYGDKHIGIEIKSSKNWKRQYSRGLVNLLEKKKISNAYGVYLGNNPEQVGEVLVLDVNTFLNELSKGAILYH
jgi:uncharacterized protein